METNAVYLFGCNPCKRRLRFCEGLADDNEQQAKIKPVET
jgi:hypothetical protein